MKPSPIQLTEFFVTELTCTANPKFDPKQQVPLHFDDFQISIESSVKPEDKRAWNISLKLKHQPAAEANVPYRFTVEIVGFFVVHPKYLEEKVERLAKTNGPSLLFGILREIIRDTTGRGPFSPVLLPSVSFYEPEPKPEGTESAASQQPQA